MSVLCDRCQKEIAPEDRNVHNNQTLCDECYLDARITRPRKTHWQYIGSLKTEYLRPAEE